MTTLHEAPSVALHADDPLTLAGIATHLAQRRFVVTDGTEGGDDVAVVVADALDGRVQQLIHRLHRKGVDGVLLVVAHLDDHALFSAIEAGVTGVLRREDATQERLVAAIEDVRAGHGVMSPDLVGRVVGQVRQLHQQVLEPRGMHVAGLSEREVDVLRLVADGLSTSEIAEKLAYSERTIKNIIQGVTTRLQLRNRAHAVAYALRHGFI
ncbi:MAG: LuxR C-terminal-related transcriptional regulator [Actinomycetota bacterium]